MKIVVFWLKFHWNLFPGVQLTEKKVGLNNDLTPNKPQAVIWTNDGLIYRRIYAALRLNELMYKIWYTDNRGML